MIYLTSGYKRTVQAADSRLHAMGLGYMQTPAAGARIKMLQETNAVWAADNGCYSQGDRFVMSEYLAWLGKMLPVQIKCLFATAPDVVGNSKETWERSKDTLPMLRELGYKAAFIGQDGMEDMAIEWDTFDCLFIGGTTAWKLSEAAYEIATEAKRRGKWLHMGRVNSRRRMVAAAVSGFDSVDGTHLVFGPDKRLPQLEAWLQELQRQSHFQFA